MVLPLQIGPRNWPILTYTRSIIGNESDTNPWIESVHPYFRTEVMWLTVAGSNSACSRKKGNFHTLSMCTKMMQTSWVLHSSACMWLCVCVRLCAISERHMQVTGPLGGCLWLWVGLVSVSQSQEWQFEGWGPKSCHLPLDTWWVAQEWERTHNSTTQWRHLDTTTHPSKALGERGATLLANPATGSWNEVLQGKKSSAPTDGQRQTIYIVAQTSWWNTIAQLQSRPHQNRKCQVLRYVCTRRHKHVHTTC